MNEHERINNDFTTLFCDGRQLLDNGCSAVMNAQRDEAFAAFNRLGGVPCKKEDYCNLNLLPLFGKDYQIPLKYIHQEVDMNEAFRCSVTDLATNPVLTVNGWWFDGNEQSEIPDEVTTMQNSLRARIGK